MVPRKGVDTVVRAVGRLRHRQGLPVRLLIVGGSDRRPDPERDPELARLMGIARDEGVEEAVTLVGRRDRAELATYYSAADAFVSTPWYEPFGITPLEAMACGTPVIGSNVGGIKFTVRDGETGYLVPASDADAVAERAARICRDPVLRDRLGDAGRRRAHARFTWRRVAGELSAALDRTGPSAPPLPRFGPPAAAKVMQAGGAEVALR
jgi:glycosyltransferase involved in cell wall biosynthesis